MSGYLRHIELSRQLEEKAKEASQNRQLAEERIEQLEGLIATAKKADVKVDEAEELLGQANSAVAGKDYKLALEKTREGEDKAKAAFLQQGESILDASEPILALLKRTETDTSEFSALLGSARDALEKGNFEEGVETAKRAWSKLEKTLHESLSQSFSSVQSRILAAKAIDKDASMAEDLLAQARSALDGSDYQEALSQTEEALDFLGRELDFELEKERKTVDELLQAGSALKADVAKAEGYLGKAAKGLEAGDYEKAFNSLKQARTEAERQLKKAIEGGRASLKGPLDEARKLGVDVGPVERTAQDAVEAAKEEDFPRASELIRQALQDLEGAKFRLVLDTISQSRPKFLKARELGVDIVESMEIFNRAREALQEGKHKDALFYAQKGNEELDRLVKEFADASSRMKARAEEIRAFAQTGRRLTEAEGLLKEAGRQLSQGDLKAWSAAVERVETALKQARTDRSEELLEECNFLVTLGEKLDLDLVQENEAIHECSQVLKSGDAERALTDATDLRRRTEERIQAHFQERVDDVRSNLPSGEEPEDVAELLLKTETALEVKDYGTAAGLLEEAEAKGTAVAQENAARVLDGLQAAHELAEAHDLEDAAVEETYQEARKAWDAGKYGALLAQGQEIRKTFSPLTQKSFDAVKARVVEARNSGVDIDAHKALLLKAKESITRGNLAQGLVHLRDCDRMAQQSLDLFQKVRDTMAAAAVLVAEGKKKEVNVGRAVDLLMKGKAAFEAGQLEKALDIARSAREEAEKELSVLNVTDKIMQARETLDLAQALQVDVGPWTNLLARAEKSLDKHDFREAVELAMEVEAQARSGIRNSVNARLARAQGLLERLPASVPDVPERVEDLKRVRELLEGRELREAAELSRDVLARGEELAEAHQGTLQAIKLAEGLLPELQSMNVKVSGPEKLLSKAQKALEDGNLKLGRQLADEALTQLKKERGDGIDRTIKSFEASVAKAKKEGINTARAEELLSIARKRFDEGRYEEALATAMQSEGVVEKMGLQKEIAENSLENARRRTLALPTEVPFLTKLLRQAEAAYEAGDYVKSLEAAITATDELSRVRDTWEQLETAEDEALKALQILQSVGIDASKFERLRDEAQVLSGKGDLDGAKETYERLSTEASGAVSTYLTQLHTQARNARVLCSLLDCEMEGLDARLSEGFGYLEEDQFVNAYTVLSQALAEVQKVLGGKVQGLIAEAKRALEHAQNLGVDVQEAAARIQEAEKALAEGVFERAVRLAQETHDALKAQEDVHQKLARVTYEAEALLKTAKKFGIPIQEAEGALQAAMDRREQNPQGALAEAERSLALVQESLDAFSPALEVDLEMESALTDRPAEGVLTVRNASKALAKDLEVEVLGDFDVAALEVPAAVRGNGEATIPLRVTFHEAGTVPFMVKARAKRVIDDQEYEWEQVFEVPVGGD